MADFRSYLESLVLTPKDPTIYDVDKFSPPFDLITFLYMVRDHYVKYQTVDYLFTKITNTKTSQLGTVDYLKSLDAEIGTNKGVMLDASSIASRLGVPFNLQYFIAVTLTGYTLPSQALTLNYISNPDDANAVFKRVDLQAYNLQVLKNGVYVNERHASMGFEDINGTTIFSASVMPTPNQVFNIINDILNGAYTYYTNPVKAPEFNAIVNYIKTNNLDITKLRSLFDSLFQTTSVRTGVVSYGFDFYISSVSYISSQRPDFKTNILGYFISNYFSYSKVKNQIDFFTSILGVSNRKYYAYSFILNKTTGVYTPVFTNTKNETSPYDLYIRYGDGINLDYNYTKLEEMPSMFDVDKIGYNNINVVLNRIISTMKLIIDNYDLVIGGIKPIKNSWITSTVPSSRFRTYLNYFTSGKITLEYLKAIQVQDKILASDLGKDLYLFPAFLILQGDTTVDPYDSNFLRVNSTVIKNELANVISYIVNQLFAQDINLLNNIGARFKTAIDINNQSKAKLKEEQDKLAQIDAQLKAQILEAKKIYTAFEVVMSNFANNPDPVITYQSDMEKKMQSELDKFQAEQIARINAEAQLKKEQALRDQLALVQQQEQERLAQQAKQAELDRIAQQEKAQAQVSASATMQQTDKVIEANYSTNVTPINVSEKATTISQAEAGTTKKSALPLVAGVGLLAYLALGGKE